MINKNIHNFTKLLINNFVVNDVITKRVLNKLPNAEKIYFEDNNLKEILALHDSPNTLLLTKLKGDPVVMCPGTTKYHCCNYRILNVGHNCSFGCTYCILQDYLKTESISVFTDTTSYMQKNIIGNYINSKQLYRIGTGEFTDSLIADEISELSTDLVNVFKDHKNVILELKTKSVSIENLLKIEPANNIIVAWSVNSELVTNSSEKDTPSLDERLKAAKKITDHGYDVAFHFDPVILYKDYTDDYKNTINKIYKIIPKEKIRWISIGTLRFTKGLKPTFIRKSPLYMDEFILADDQKFRYLRFRREKAYKELIDAIKNHHPDQFVYLCMESPTIWKNVFGFNFKDNEEFEKWFNEKVFTHL